MKQLYFVLAAVHIVTMTVTGILWTILILTKSESLRTNLRDIRAVHFGSLYLVPWFLGLAYAFEELRVPEWHQYFFPAGLGALIFFSGLGWLFPTPEGLDPFYYWTHGPAKILAIIGLVCLVFCLFWTAGVLIYYSV